MAVRGASWAKSEAVPEEDLPEEKGSVSLEEGSLGLLLRGQELAWLGCWPTGLRHEKSRWGMDWI